MSEKPACPACQQALVKHNELKKRLYRYMFQNQQLNISHNEGIISYTAVYDLIDKNTQQKMKNQKIYELYEMTFSKIFKKDLREFAIKIRHQLSELKGVVLDPQEELKIYYQWVTKFTRFLFWNRLTFSPIQKNHKVYNKSSLYHQGLMILKSQIIEHLYDNIFGMVIQNLENFKQGKLQQYFQLQLIIRTIGMCGFSKFKSVQLEKNELEQFQFTSINKQTRQKSEMEYETDFFQKNFTPKLIKYFENKYKQISEKMLKLSTPQYVNSALDFLQKQQKAAQYFYPHQKVKSIVIRSVQQILIMEKAQHLLGNEKTGLFALYEVQDTQSLKMLFKLLRRTSQQKLYCQYFQNYIEKKVADFLNTISAQQEKMAKKQIVKQLIQKIFHFYIKLQNITNHIQSFMKGPIEWNLIQSMKIGFQNASNKTPTISNFLVYYTDNILKREDSAQNNTAELVIKLSKLIKILYSLDHFLKVYQRMLGVRILYDLYKNRNAELQIINLLKNQVGVSSMNKINMMIQDFRYSQQLCRQRNQAFKNDIPFSMQVMFLTSGSWQIATPKDDKKVLPPELQKPAAIYESYYDSIHKGRKIMWIFNYGRSVALVKFNTASYLLHLNNYQLLILLFLQRNNFSSSKISHVISQIRPQDEPAFFASISMLVKKGVLTKTGSSPKIQNKQQIISFNKTLKSRTPKIGCFQIPRLTQKQSVLSSQLAADRAILIQASIVKLMKAKRVLAYKQIIPEVTKMCKTFNAEVSMIKNQIELCIHKQFLERDEKDLNTLIYKP